MQVMVRTAKMHLTTAVVWITYPAMRMASVETLVVILLVRFIEERTALLAH